MEKWALCIGCVIAVVLGITLIISFVAAKRKKKAIEEVLIQDQRDDFDTVAEKCEYISKINLTKCPMAFRKKYIAHVNAWEQFAIVEEELQFHEKKYNSVSAFFEGFLRGLDFDLGMIGEANASRENLKNHYLEVREIIQNTFSDVLACAAEYGVDTSKYR